MNMSLRSRERLKRQCQENNREKRKHLFFRDRIQFRLHVG
jgi:hypothetical protein